MILPVVVALSACVIAAIGEGLFMGREGPRYMKALQQPRYAPSSIGWSLIGIGYYVLCFFGLWRLTARPGEGGVSTGLLLLVMLANTFWNYVYFRMHDLRLAFWYSVAYACMFAVLIVTLFRTDRSVALGFCVYAAYLPYALLLGYQTWKLNVDVPKRT
jgi:tryptophan-rich sensory protein